MTEEEANKLAAAHARKCAAVGYCCGNAEWRGRLCQYHQGIEDGYYAGLLAADHPKENPDA